MINFDTAHIYCSDDISLIENYEQALNDKTQVWHCHHKNGITLNKTPKELNSMGLYENRPASELIFLTPFEHNHLHHKGKGNESGAKNPNAKIIYVDGIEYKCQKDMTNAFGFNYWSFGTWKYHHKSGDIYEGHCVEW